MDHSECMEKIQGFRPIASKTAKVLVLGTLPGQLSLEKGEYYAQPRNAFWFIMRDLFGIDAQSPYEARTRQLTQHGVALWDVCAAGDRLGSLDAFIRGEVANKFEEFLAAHPQIRLICFNVKKAAELYERCVFDSLPGKFRLLRRQTLPSTSPA